MKVKLDENVPTALQDLLSALGHDTDTVPNEGLCGNRDTEVWRAAQEAGSFLVTQDLDFSDIRQLPPGSHAGIMLVRLAMPGRTALVERVATVFAREAVNSWQGCLVIVTDRKIRVRRPGE